MKKRDLIIALILAFCLVFSVVAVLFIKDGGFGKKSESGYTYELLITEVCAKNGSILQDEDGAYSDYIEICNLGPDTDLQGCSLTDGKSVFRLEGATPLRSGGYKVLFLSKERTGFALSASGGETLMFNDPNGKTVCRVTTVAMEEDEVMSWNGSSYELTEMATPGFPNTEEGRLMFTVGNPTPPTELILSEIVPSNKTLLPHANGMFCDYVEIQNISDHDVELSEYFLSDQMQNRFRGALPGKVLHPGEYAIVFCSKECTDERYDHLSFGLSAGETVFLTKNDGSYQSVTVPTTLGVNLAYALVDGEYRSYAPTPGFSNNEEGIKAYAASLFNPDAQLIITEVCSKNSGIIRDGDGLYSDYIEICNQGADCDLQGCTLSDGKTDYTLVGDHPLKNGEYKILFLKKEITGFGLSSAGGETLTLRDPSGNVLAQIITLPLGEDQVMSYNGETYECTDKATPGYPNTDEGRALFLSGVLDLSPVIVISEVLTVNKSVLPHGDKKHCDYVELHNISSEPVNLSGYYLSDRMEERFLQALPNVTLAPDGYFVLFCSSSCSGSDKPHLSFGLSAGETLVLTNPEGKYNTLSLPATGEDITWSLVGSAYTAYPPTPGLPNNELGVQSYKDGLVDPDPELVINEYLLSSSGVPVGGKITDVVELYNPTDGEVSTAGWYFTDDPDDPYRYLLPEAVVPAHGYVLLYCDRTDAPWHTGFGLSRKDVLQLTSPSYLRSPTVECVSFGEGLSANRASGIAEDDSGYTAELPSLGFANTLSGQKAFANASLPNALRISEVMSLNDSYLPGAYKTTCDWVELYNASSQAINLSDYYLSDDAKEPYAVRLPDVTVKAGEYYVLFLSKTTENLKKGYPVLPLALSASGDRLYLSKGSEVADYVLIPRLGADVAYGRPNGESAFAILATPTPEKANSASAVPSEPPVALTSPGVYNNVTTLNVSLSGDGTIYYTTGAGNCPTPTVNSARYTGPIPITKTTVVRAICVSPGKKPSEVLDLTYIVNENHTLPVASLVTEYDNLWDWNTGIYVMGPGAAGQSSPYFGANFWKKGMEWEKEATVSLYEKDGSGFSLPCGIRIFGAYSRAQPQKSFAVHFRSRYGASELAYPLFGEESLDTYGSFVFRNTGQDINYTRIRDAMLTDLASAGTGLDHQENRPVILYLNGEYWGIYFIREKINEDFIAGHYDVSPDEVTLTYGNGKGSLDYRALIDYVKKHDLSVGEYYDHVAEWMDIDNFIDYIIVEICIGNDDNGNIKFYRTDNGKWRWILYDVDKSFREIKYDAVSEHLNPKGTGAADMFETVLINGLLKNPGFKEKFLTRFAWQMNNVWTTENMISYIRTYRAMIEPEIVRDRERWEYDLARWKEKTSDLELIAKRRPAEVLKHVQNYFSLTDAQMRAYGFAI